MTISVVLRCPLVALGILKIKVEPWLKKSVGFSQILLLSFHNMIVVFTQTNRFCVGSHPGLILFRLTKNSNFLPLFDHTQPPMVHL